MSAVTEAAPVTGLGAPRRSLAARVAGRIGGGTIRIILVLVGLFWLLPTVGLLAASLRSVRDDT